MILFISYWGKPFKSNRSREVCTYATCAKPLFSNAHPDKLIRICYGSTWKCLILGVSFGNKDYMLQNLKSCYK